MNILSILGSLPGSDSPSGSVNKTDYMKMARMGIMLVGGYCITAILTTLLHDLSGGAFNLPEALVTPLTGLVTLVLEATRRYFAKPL